MFFNLQITAVLWVISVLPQFSSAYEILDTIHTLKDENLHLQYRLENLARALRDLKYLLTEHTKVSGGKLDTQFLHAWKEWSKHGVSAETQRMLEQALCLTELHGAAQSNFRLTPGFFIISPFISMIPLLLS